MREEEVENRSRLESSWHKYIPLHDVYLLAPGPEVLFAPISGGWYNTYYRVHKGEMVL
jgi:hypothetical protein